LVTKLPSAIHELLVSYTISSPGPRVSTIEKIQTGPLSRHHDIRILLKTYQAPLLSHCQSSVNDQSIQGLLLIQNLRLFRCNKITSASPD